MDCPAPADLVGFAFGDPVDRPVADHVRDCPACQAEVTGLREAAGELRAEAVAAPPPSTPCLIDDAIAMLADARHQSVDPSALAHLAACPRCDRRVAALARLLGDDSVAAEVRRLELVGGPRSARVPVLTAAAMVAAAALAIVFLPPAGPAGSGPATHGGEAPAIHRESAITTTVPPRILGPGAIAHAADSLRWTAVPCADRYEVRVFDGDGTLVWNPSTSDTVIAMREELLRAAGTTYLWKVEARTGLGRWVASEWADFTIGAEGFTR